MARYKLLVLTNPVAGRETEFNDWYSNRHVPDLLTVKGVKGAQRLRQKMGVDTWRYMAIYDLDCDDPAEVVAEMQQRTQSGEFAFSTSLDTKSAYNAVFEPMPSGA